MLLRRLYLVAFWIVYFKFLGVSKIQNYSIEGCTDFIYSGSEKFSLVVKDEFKTKTVLQFLGRPREGEHNVQFYFFLFDLTNIVEYFRK